ncbi:MAG: DUF3795 domain-containing protein [Promethearchaeota archaeon]
MRDLDINDVKEEDRYILAPCGILCLGCDFYIGEAIEAAKKIQEIWEGWNIIDLSMVMGLNREGIQSTLDTIKKFLKLYKNKCPGCFNGGIGSKICGIAKCVNSKGYWTCAECDDYDPDSQTPCPYVIDDAIIMTDKGKTTKMICERYNHDPSNNLKSCRQIGYNDFIEEAKKKVRNGWRTWKIISNKTIFSIEYR